MRTDYSDLTLIIPFRIDSPEREANLRRCQDFFSKFEGLKFIKKEDKPGPHFFHKTRLINEGLREVKSRYFGILDCDIICPIVQFRAAVESLRAELTDFVYPYDGTFVDIPQEVVDAFLNKTLPTPHEFNVLNFSSVGGLIMGRTAAYQTAGGENQNFKSWGPEDMERHERLMALGYRVARVEGHLFHMGHPREVNSCEANPYFKDNNTEFARIASIPSLQAFRTEVESWPWYSPPTVLDLAVPAP